MSTLDSSLSVEPSVVWQGMVLVRNHDTKTPPLHLLPGTIVAELTIIINVIALNVGAHRALRVSWLLLPGKSEYDLVDRNKPILGISVNTDTPTTDNRETNTHSANSNKTTIG